MVALPARLTGRVTASLPAEPFEMDESPAPSTLAVPAAASDAKRDDAVRSDREEMPA